MRSNEWSSSVFVTSSARSLLWRIPARGSSADAPQQLAGVTEGAVNPAISRPAAGAPVRLAYERQVIDTNIWLAELNESGRLQQRTTPLIASTRLDITPQISPDGKKVVYVRRFADASTDKRYSNLWIINTDGTDHRPLTTGNRNDASPRWSPDGTRIAYLAEADGKERLIATMLATMMVISPGPS